MKKNEIERKIFYIVLNEVKSKAKFITINTNVREFGWSSIDIIEVILALEAAFKINITSDEEIDSILNSGTIDNLIDYIYKRMEK